MKKLITLLLIINSINFYSQDFEGIIEYKMTYISKKENMSVDVLQKNLGQNVTSYIKNGYYKEICNSTFMSYQLFRHKDDKIYFHHNNDVDTLRTASTISKNKNDLKYELIKKSDTILNTLCDKLIVSDKYGKKTYYYSSMYSLDPEFYKNYTISNKYEIMKIMKSVYLRLEMEYDSFIVNIEAISIKKTQLENDVFNIPRHKILKTE